MKAIAARRRDVDDLRLLTTTLGLTQPDQVIEVCNRVFPDETLPDRARLILEDVFGNAGRGRVANVTPKSQPPHSDSANLPLP